MNNSRGYSLVEVIVGVALVAIAIGCVAQGATQLSRVQVRYAASMRLDSTVNNIVTDARALLRYESPAATALQAGIVPATFTVYQTEPDLAQAPVACSAEHLTEVLDVIHIVCHDRSGLSTARDIDLSNTQPFPGSIVTASPPPAGP